MVMLISQGEIIAPPLNNQVDVRFTAELQAEDMPHGVMQKLLSLSLLNIEIEDFNDGRVFSFVRLLKTRYQYKGEVRVSGKYLIDQMAMLKACGVDSFLLSEGSDYEHALFILSNTPENTFCTSDQKKGSYEY